MKTESNKKDVLKMSNIESNLFTKECIQVALLQLLTETPYDKVTITSIIERAGVSRAGFYRNYSSKEKILEEIASSLSLSLDTLLTNKLYQENPKLWLINLFSQIKANANYFRVLIEANVPQKFFIKIGNFLEGTTEAVSTAEHYLFIAIAASVKEICIDWFQNGMKESPEEMAELILEIFAEHKPSMS